MNTEKSLGCSNRRRDIVIFNLLGCRPPASWISLDLCNGPNSHEGRIASPCQISSQSLKPQLRYVAFSIFQILTVARVKSVERRHHAKFDGDFLFFKLSVADILNLKILHFNGLNGQEDRTASMCQIMSKSFEPRPRYGDFSIFPDGGSRHFGFFEVSNI